MTIRTDWLTVSFGRRPIHSNDTNKVVTFIVEHIFRWTIENRNELEVLIFELYIYHSMNCLALSIRLSLLLLLLLFVVVVECFVVVIIFVVSIIFVDNTIDDECLHTKPVVGELSLLQFLSFHAPRQSIDHSANISTHRSSVGLLGSPLFHFK